MAAVALPPFLAAAFVGVFFPLRSGTAFVLTLALVLAITLLLTLPPSIGLDVLHDSLNFDPTKDPYITPAIVLGPLALLSLLAGFFAGTLSHGWTRRLPVFDLATFTLAPLDANGDHHHKFSCAVRSIPAHPVGVRIVAWWWRAKTCVVSWRWDPGMIQSKGRNYRRSPAVCRVLDEAKKLGFRYVALDAVSLDQAAMDASAVYYFSQTYSWMPVIVDVPTAVARDEYSTRFWTNVEVLSYRKNPRVFVVGGGEPPLPKAATFWELLRNEDVSATYALDRLKVYLVQLPFPTIFAYGVLGDIQRATQANQDVRPHDATLMTQAALLLREITYPHTFNVMQAVPGGTLFLPVWATMVVLFPLVPWSTCVDDLDADVQPLRRRVLAMCFANFTLVVFVTVLGLIELDRARVSASAILPWQVYVVAIGVAVALKVAAIVVVSRDLRRRIRAALDVGLRGPVRSDADAAATADDVDPPLHIEGGLSWFGDRGDVARAAVRRCFRRAVRGVGCTQGGRREGKQEHGSDGGGKTGTGAVVVVAGSV